jgi:hypothetical protein
MQNFIEYRCSSAKIAISEERWVQLLLFTEMMSYYREWRYVCQDKSVQKTSHAICSTFDIGNTIFDLFINRLICDLLPNLTKLSCSTSLVVAIMTVGNTCKYKYHNFFCRTIRIIPKSISVENFITISNKWKKYENSPDPFLTALVCL